MEEVMVAQAIWKYTIDKIGENLIEMPKGSEVLSVGKQDRLPVIWVLVDPSQPFETRNIVNVFTGRELATAQGGLLRFLGTIQIEEHEVVHIFEAVDIQNMN